MAESDINMLSWRGSDEFYKPYIGRGEVLFTGPDGITDHQVSVIDCKYVGIGTMSPEGTSDLNYLWRATKSCPHPPPKSIKVGEIGWGLRTDEKLLRSGHQIRSGEFRRSCEDRHTHLYQNPWYPGPCGIVTPKNPILQNLKSDNQQGESGSDQTATSRPQKCHTKDQKPSTAVAEKPRSNTHPFVVIGPTTLCETRSERKLV